MGKVCHPQAYRPQTGWNQKTDDAASQLTNQKNVHKVITSSLNHYCTTPHYRLQVGGHSFLRALAAVASFAWQSNKAILFYFTQNSVSEIWFGVKIKRLD